MKRTKPIQKRTKNSHKQQPKEQPQLKHLSDFVVSIKSIYCSKAIYTGGRILTCKQNIYAICNNDINVYSIEQDQIINTIKHNNEEIVNFGICSNEKYLLTFTNNYLLRLIVGGKIIHTIKTDKFYAYDIAFSPDNKYVAIGYVNSTIKIYTLQTMKQTHSYRAHKFCVRKVQWHPNVQQLQVISIDQERNLIVFDYILNKVIAQMDNAGKNFVLTPKGTNIITSCDKSIKVYQTQQLKIQYKVDVEYYIDAIYLHSHGNSLFFGGQQTQLYTMNLNNPDHTIDKVQFGTDSGILKILPINKKSFMTVSLQQNFTILSADNLQQQNIIVGYNDEIIDLKYSKNKQSNFFLMATNSNNVKIMNRQTHKLCSLIQGHKQIVLTIDFSYPYALTAGKDKIIKLWKITHTGRSHLIANYRGHSEDISGVALDIEKKIILSVSQDKTIKVWSLCPQSEQKIQIKSSLHTILAHNKSINCIKISPKYFATCSQDRSIKLWQWNNEQINPIVSLQGHKRGVWDAIFHKVEHLLVSVAGDGMMKGWNLLTFQCLWSMGEGSGLLKCAWLYYNQVITGSVDGIIKIWDIRKQSSLSYDKHQGKIWALDVIQDQNNKCEIMTGGNDSKFYVWKDNTQQTRDMIIERQQENQLTKLSYNQFMHEGKFFQAAKIAFEGNYTNLFIISLHKAYNQFDANTSFKQNQQGDLQLEQHSKIDDKDLQKLIAQLCLIDLNRLLCVLEMMNSTVKNFKIANKILYILAKLRGLKSWQNMDKTFTNIHPRQQQISTEKTEFEDFLHNMELYTEKHYKRLERYKKNSYWFDYLDQKNNPYNI